MSPELPDRPDPEYLERYRLAVREQEGRAPVDAHIRRRCGVAE